MVEMDVGRNCVFILFFVSCLVCHGSAEVVTENFDAKPGGEVHEYVAQKNGLTFKFIYAAQGGTNEQWSAQVEDGPAGSVKFSVGRPGGTSYLFFQQFRLQVDGAEIIEANAMSDGSSNLRPNEYTTQKNFVEQVDGSFEAHLASAYIVVKKANNEL